MAGLSLSYPLNPSQVYQGTNFGVGARLCRYFLSTEYFSCTGGANDEAGRNVSRARLPFGFSWWLPFFLLGCWVIWDCVVDSQLRPTTASGDSSKNFWLDRAIPVYRCCGVFLLLMWSWGLSLLVWSRARVNYMFMFELQDGTWLSSYKETFLDAANLTLFYLVNLLVFYKGVQGYISLWFPNNLLPLALVLVLLAYMLFPWSRRRGFWRVAFNVLISPFGNIGFREWFCADVITSLVKPLYDLQYTLCFFGTGRFLRDADVKRMLT